MCGGLTALVTCQDEMLLPSSGPVFPFSGVLGSGAAGVRVGEGKCMGRVRVRAPIPPVVVPERNLGAGRVGAWRGGPWAPGRGAERAVRGRGPGWGRAAGTPGDGRGPPARGGGGRGTVGSRVCCGPQPGDPTSLGRPVSGLGNVSPLVAFLCYHRLVRKII